MDREDGLCNGAGRLGVLCVDGRADAANAGNGSTELASVDSAGNQANGNSLDVAISADGRFVVFVSYADNLVPGDTNGVDFFAGSDVFVHDRKTGVTERVSVDSAGNQANGNSLDVAISADGRFVAFISFAGNLVPGDTNAASDVFVHTLPKSDRLPPRRLD